MSKILCYSRSFSMHAQPIFQSSPTIADVDRVRPPKGTSPQREIRSRSFSQFELVARRVCTSLRRGANDRERNVFVGRNFCVLWDVMMLFRVGLRLPQEIFGKSNAADWCLIPGDLTWVLLDYILLCSLAGSDLRFGNGRQRDKYGWPHFPENGVWHFASSHSCEA